MFKVNCLYDNEYRYETAYDINEIDYRQLTFSILKDKKDIEYISLPITFDIETSTIKDEYKTLKEDRDIYEGFMYHWQVCLFGKVIFGRTWKDIKYLFDTLIECFNLGADRKLVCYVHNLSYEFHFMYKFFNFTNVFATDKHKILRCEYNGIEFRCSYYLSNMNLKKFIENSHGTHHQKGSGDLDYRKIYTPSTILTEKELGYCYNDVVGLYESILSLLKDDDLTTIPMTSTGYVRRDCRNAMRKNKKNRKLFVNSQLDIKQYNLLKECFRGGNTASNRYMTNMIINNVSSYDISSSYPYVMLSEKFPTGKFMECSLTEPKDLEYYNNKYCTIGRYIFTNLRIKENVPIPYIPYSKCNAIKNPLAYNGRILESDMLEISLTNIDYNIIQKQYDFDELFVKDLYIARKAFLPKELRDVIKEYYYFKTTLKDNDKKLYEYMKSKNKLNGIYGMTVTDILHDIIYFDSKSGEFTIEKEENIEKYYKSRNNFLSYQWGVFVTAYARKNLQKGLDAIGMDVIYCDTDSVKYVGNHDDVFEHINKEIIEYCDKNNIINYVDFKGKRFYLGVFDKEKGYDRFITLGAKKYAFEQNGDIGITVAGLNKKDGAKELKKKGGLEYFRDGEIFYNSGRTVAQYNNDDIHYITVNGEDIETASNIAIYDTTYTLGMTDEMKSIIETLKEK